MMRRADNYDSDEDYLMEDEFEEDNADDITNDQDSVDDNMVDVEDGEPQQPTRRERTARDERSGRFIGTSRQQHVPETDSIYTQLVNYASDLMEDAQESRQGNPGARREAGEEMCALLVGDLNGLSRADMRQIGALAKRLHEQKLQRRVRQPLRLDSIQAILDHMPQPDRAGCGLSPERMVQIQGNLDTNPSWMGVRDTPIPGSNCTFMAMWKAVCAAGTCPTEIISARQYLTVATSAWSSSFCGHLRNLALGSPCKRNWDLLATFIRLVVASRMDDHRAVPVAGFKDDSFMATYAKGMDANTDGKSLKEVYGAAVAGWTQPQHWHARVIDGINKLRWASGVREGRDLKGLVTPDQPYTLKTDDLRRLIQIFDQRGPAASKDIPGVEEKASAIYTKDKSHRLPRTIEDLDRLRQRSVLLDIYFVEGRLHAHEGEYGVDQDGPEHGYGSEPEADRLEDVDINLIESPRHMPEMADDDWSHNPLRHDGRVFTSRQAFLDYRFECGEFMPSP